MLTDLHLALENLISDFLPCLAHIWPLAHHALIGYDPKCVIVNCEGMVLLAQDFRRHVAWCPARLFRVFLLKVPCNAKVCHSKIPALIQHNVFGLYVSVNYIFLMEIVECLKKARDKELGLLLRELLAFVDMVSQIAPC